MKPLTITFIEFMIVLLVYISIALENKDFRFWNWNKSTYEDLIFGIVIGNAMMLLIVYTDAK